MTSFLSANEQATLDALNLARTKPKEFAEKLKARRANFRDKLYCVPGKIDLRTKEGVSAVNEAIQALEQQKPLQPFTCSAGLSSAARDHVRDQGPTGKTGHDGSNGSTMSQRIERHGKWDLLIGENIDYGNNDGFEIVAALLIDDGVPSRGHRENILNPAFTAVAIAIGPHQVFKHMCCMDFAGKFTEKNSNESNAGHARTGSSVKLPAAAGATRPRAVTTGAAAAATTKTGSAARSPTNKSAGSASSAAGAKPIPAGEASLDRKQSTTAGAGAGVAAKANVQTSTAPAVNSPGSAAASTALRDRAATSTAPEKHAGPARLAPKPPGAAKPSVGGAAATASTVPTSPTARAGSAAGRAPDSKQTITLRGSSDCSKVDATLAPMPASLRGEFAPQIVKALQSGGTATITLSGSSANIVLSMSANW